MSFGKLPASLRSYILLHVVAVGPLLWLVWGSHRASAPLVAASLLAAAAVAGTWRIKLTVVRGRQSLVFAVACLALLLQGGWIAVLCAAVGALANLVAPGPRWWQIRLVRKAPWYRRVFNVTHCALVCAAAVLVRDAVTPLFPPGGLTGVLAGMATFTTVYFLLNTLGVAAAIAMEQGSRPVEVWKEHLLWTAPGYFVSALAAVALWSAFRIAGPPALLLLPSLYLLYRGYQSYIEALKRARELAAQVEELYQKEEAANRRKDEFLAMLAHELRNPLGAITNAHYLLEKGSDRDPSRLLAVIGHQTNHLKRLVDDLLDVSRITRGVVELRPEPFDLRRVLQGALEAVRPLVGTRGHHVTVDVPEEALPARVDPVRMEQVFANLLTNAAKYTAPGGRIDVRLARDGERCLLRVRDSGIGIAPELLPRVFDLFVQADRSLAHSEGGLGIGLTLVKRLVELHGGEVEASSPGLGKGSEFVVRLPLDAERSFAAAGGPGEERSTRPATVLLVEDNEDASQTLAEMLELWGYRVLVAGTGPEGLALAIREAPEAVLLDIGLPGMDGYEVARRLRQEGRDIRLVALTGYGRAEDRESAVAAGFDCHLVKPVRPEEVQALLARLLDRQGEPSAGGLLAPAAPEAGC